MNLIGASKLILFDIDWNPANDIQVWINIAGCMVAIQTSDWLNEALPLHKLATVT